MNETVIDHWNSPSEVTKALIGSWSFDRIVEGQATMQGVATFTPLDAERLAYREQGRLKLQNGTELEAEREYVFRKRDRGFEVFFKETPPRLFHAIELAASDGGGLSGSAGHLCSPDHYQSTYASWPMVASSFVMSCRVRARITRWSRPIRGRREVRRRFATSLPEPGSFERGEERGSLGRSAGYSVRCFATLPRFASLR